MLVVSVLLIVFVFCVVLCFCVLFDFVLYLLPNVASVSGLSILYSPMWLVSLDCPFFIAQCGQCLWIVHSL